MAWASPFHYNFSRVRTESKRLMIRQAALRRWSTWLIGLFFLAQIGGVVRLLGEHTAHVTESQLAVAHATVDGNASHSHHHDGDADGAIQHHELQDLNGAPVRLIAIGGLSVTPANVALYVPDVLAGRNPVLPERPPKPSLSV
jgi:hypothetical protein